MSWHGREGKWVSPAPAGATSPRDHCSGVTDLGAPGRGAAGRSGHMTPALAPYWWRTAPWPGIDWSALHTVAPTFQFFETFCCLCSTAVSWSLS